MKTVSIGFQREDGDFAVLATLNNNDGDMTDDAFHALVRTVHTSLVKFNAYVVVLERQDTPDYISI
jgi:hypothetical protein